jgi:hypothetical protein
MWHVLNPACQSYLLHGLLLRKKEKGLKCKVDETTNDMKKGKKGNGRAVPKLTVAGLYPSSPWPRSLWLDFSRASCSLRPSSWAEGAGRCRGYGGGGRQHERGCRGHDSRGREPRLLLSNRSRHPAISDRISGRPSSHPCLGSRRTRVPRRVRSSW